MARGGLVGNFSTYDTYANILIPEGNIVMLDEQKQNEFEGLLAVVECLESLKSKESNKSS